jgi:hypothetical protein
VPRSKDPESGRSWQPHIETVPRLDSLKANWAKLEQPAPEPPPIKSSLTLYVGRRKKTTIVKANNMANHLNVDDAICAILDLIRRRRSDISTNGYDVYLSGVCNIYAIESGMVLAGDRSVDRVGNGLLPIFAAAGWELCRRGILRPGVQNVALNHPLNAFSPDRGYSITPAGERWFATANPCFMSLSIRLV